MKILWESVRMQNCALKLRSAGAYAAASGGLETPIWTMDVYRRSRAAAKSIPVSSESARITRTAIDWRSPPQTAAVCTNAMPPLTCRARLAGWLLCGTD